MRNRTKITPTDVPLIVLDDVLDRVQSRIGAVTRTVRSTDSLPAA